MGTGGGRGVEGCGREYDADDYEGNENADGSIEMYEAE